jgi:hypothetical protein
MSGDLSAKTIPEACGALPNDLKKKHSTSMPELGVPRRCIQCDFGLREPDLGRAGVQPAVCHEVAARLEQTLQALQSRDQR